MIIGMEWLEKLKVALNCFDKTFTYVTEDKIIRKVNGFRKHVSLRETSSLQLRKCFKKGYKFSVVKFVDLLLNENPIPLRGHLVLNEFMNVFLG